MDSSLGQTLSSLDFPYTLKSSNCPVFVELIYMSVFSVSRFPVTWINKLGGRVVNDD